MNKRRFIEKQNDIIRKSNKQKVLENRIARLERTMNESRDPGDFLLELAEEGALSWETLARELVAEASTDDLKRTCQYLDVPDYGPDEDDDDDYWNESIRRRR